MSETEEPTFQLVAKRSSLRPHEKQTIEIEDRFVVLVADETGVYCVDDVCTHDGGTLGDGEMEGHCLVCPRHGAKFDYRTGEAVQMPATEHTLSHEVKVEGDNVYVRLRDR